MLALNIEWLGQGQLKTSVFSHQKANQLDLCGASSLAVFYLSMERGLDVLLQQNNVDPERVAVTGLSGGGWQSILLGALDNRIKLANPVAGYSAFLTRIQNSNDLGDAEQSPPDLAVHADYTHLTALMAPRPLLLTYNGNESCCFRAELALPPLLASAQLTYAYYNQSENLLTHINYDPGTHNYERDNREALYKMLGDYFCPNNKTYNFQEIEVNSELHSPDELYVTLPQGNLDFHTIALSLLSDLKLHSVLALKKKDLLKWRDSRRKLLQQIIRVTKFSIEEEIDQEEFSGIKITSWKLHLNADVWTLPAIEFNQPKAKQTVIMLADGGRREMTKQVKETLGLGHNVILIDLYMLGELSCNNADYLFAHIINAVGERPLGIQVGQLVAVATWVENRYPDHVMTIQSLGPRTGVISLIAAALNPQLIEHVVLNNSLHSLKNIVIEDRTIPEYPELFCPNLLANFDVPDLVQLTWPGAVKN